MSLTSDPLVESLRALARRRGLTPVGDDLDRAVALYRHFEGAIADLRKEAQAGLNVESRDAPSATKA